MKKILLTVALMGMVFAQADAQVFGQRERREDAQGWNQNNGYNGNRDDDYNNGRRGNGNHGNRYGQNRYNNSYVRSHPLYQRLANSAYRPTDARRIDQELRRIEQMEWGFMRDNGRLGMRERSVLDQQLAYLNQRIYGGNRGYARY